MKLYTYFRSSAAYRVRIALNLKGLSYQAVPVHLLKGGGEQHQEDYRRINPSGLLPAFQDDWITLTQSMAIIEYLEEAHPTVPLLPKDAPGRARVRELAQIIGCDIHPINNLRVLSYLVKQLGLSEQAKTEWYRHWVIEGFQSLEAHLARDPGAGPFCHGDRPTIADCYLVPQVFNAQRFDIDLKPFPNIARINALCTDLPAFKAAHPSRQPDAE
ncbi:MULTISPECIES: maleylacetoacetate isomerase [unclassified Massilia]|uniref:maleylacetoacetate isomerase n=1 Tax=unclassified Massilia TaxID=2609279 RepID=UPI001B843716|nr:MULTISPECIES: maleylacetoacetate isomerase [unclassified Massilia]MBQ5941438.1 maleylacetoacetate isomerase [Massilia sp. AB1]MBQ5964028.1 maleylacetoacetate isomerase [Massilia sp. ZL223]